MPSQQDVLFASIASAIALADAWPIRPLTL
jgi:hypothetical protein